MHRLHAGGLLVLVVLASPARAEEGGLAVVGDPGLAFGDFAERVSFDFPPAALDTRPTVALVASHRALDTEVGTGWRLQATSAIRRRSPSNGVPGSATAIAQSMFQIDGVELVKVAGPGISHYQPETYDGSRFEYAVSSNVWLRKRAGWTWTYGAAAANARRSIHTYPFQPPAPCSATALCNTESWFLSSVVDPFNNRIDYTYSNIATPGAFGTPYGNYSSSKDHLLSRITYGAGMAKVDFTYEPRPDLSVEMTGGTPVFHHRRLKTIRTSVGDALYSQYVLQYEDEGVSEAPIGQPTDCNNVVVPNVPHPKHSLLRKVHRTGDRPTDPQTVIRCNKYHHEPIDWASGQQIQSIVRNPFSIPLVLTDNSWKLIPAELDGDGRTDFILLAYVAHGPIPIQPSGLQTNTPIQVFIATPDEANPFATATSGSPKSGVAARWESKVNFTFGSSIWTGRKGHAIADIDQDSIPELLVEGGGTASIQKSANGSWVALVNDLDDCDLRFGELGDVDGDRRVDVIVRAHPTEGSCFARYETRWIQNLGVAPWFDSATAQTLRLPLESLSRPSAWAAVVDACPHGVTPPADFYPDVNGNQNADDWSPQAYVASQVRFDDVNHDGIADASWALYACWSGDTGRWVADPDSLYSRIFFGKGDGFFTDSGLSAGPPLLLDPVDWGAAGHTRLTPGTFAMVDLDRDGHPELLGSTFAVDGLGIGAQSCTSLAPPGANDGPEEAGFHVEPGVLLVPDQDNPLITSYAGQAWSCNAHTATPAWGDFDGDGFLDRLEINAHGTGWMVVLYRNAREVAESRMVETDNEHAGRTRLTWGFSAQAPNVNPALPINLEVIQKVVGPGGTRAMTYAGGARRGDQVTAFEEVTVAGDRGGVEAYSYVVAPWGLAKQHLGVRYRENGSVEHVTIQIHGENFGFGLYANMIRPYFNPLVRRCEYDVGFGAVDLDQLHTQCTGVGFLAPSIPQTGEPTDHILLTGANVRQILGHDRVAATPQQQTTLARVWGGSRASPPRATTSAPPSFQTSFGAARLRAIPMNRDMPGFYWPVPSPLFGKTPDVIAQEASHSYPIAFFQAPKVYVWDYGYDHPVRKLVTRFEHRDLATSADDRRIDFTWEQPSSSDYWYRLLFETTNDGAGNRLARLERSAFSSPGFDSPTRISHCGLTSPSACVTDAYKYNANGTLQKHTLPDGSFESWTRLAWCGDPLTHSDPASRVTSYTRDDRCLLLTTTREGATTTLTYDALLRARAIVTDPGAGVSSTKITRSFYYDDAPIYQPTVSAREDYAYLQPRRAERRGDGQLDLVYQDGLGRITRRTRCADTSRNTAGGAIGLVGCDSTIRRHLVWNVYGTDGQLKITTAPFEGLETPMTTGYGHDGQHRPIIVMEPVHEPGAPAWRVDKITYGAGYEERTEPTATGVTSTRRTHSTLGESVIAASTVRSSAVRDRLGLVTSVTDADGKITRFAYNTMHLLSVEERVDATGQLVRARCVMPDGTVQLRPHVRTITQRDARGRVRAEVLPDGSVLGYTYDNIDRILTRSLDGTLVRSYVYTPPTATAKGRIRVTDELGGMSATSSIDGLGRTWRRSASRVDDRWVFDRANRVISKTDIGGITTRYVRDIQDDLTSVVDPRTGTTTYNRDGSGRVTSIVDADGAIETFSYTYSGAPYQDHRGEWLLAERRYDPRGQVVHSIADGVDNAMTYDTLGRLIKLREGVSGGSQLRVTEYAYDPADRVTAITRSPVAGLQTATTTVRYDDWGRPGEIIDPDGRSIVRGFDAAGRVRRVIDQEGALLETRYDALGRVMDFQVPGGGWRHQRYLGRQSYDGERNLLRVDSYDDQPSSGVIAKVQRYTDGTGHPLAEIRPDGSTMKWRWHAGRLVRQEIRSGGAVYRAFDLHYDASGRLDRETRGSYVVSHQYTGAGRLSRTTTPDDILERTYDHGLLATETQAGVQHRFVRGPTKTWVIGEKVQRRAGPMRSTEINRDILGRIGNTETSDGSHAEVTRTYSLYDYYDNPWLEQNTIGESNVLTAWVYDRKGRPLRRTTSGTGLPGKQTIWRWYANDVLWTVQTPSNRVVGYHYGPTFDHQLDSVTLDNATVAQVNTRDLRGAITSLTLPAPVDQVRTYAYDALGRMTKRASGPLAPAAADFTWDATYHPDGKLATEVIADKVAVDDWTNRYTYDAAGRLDLEVVGKTDTTHDYVLDAAGNRLATKTTSPTGATMMNAVYDGPKLVSVDTRALAYTDWNEVSADHHGNSYARTADGELAAITSAGATPSVFARDAQGIPIAVVERAGKRRTAWDLSAGLPIEVEESGGTVLTYLSVEGMHVGIAANGVVQGITADDRGTELKHAAQVLGAATGFGAGTVAPTASDERFMFAMLERTPSASQVMLARRRTYDPITGRFLEPDPIGAAGGLELYQYSNGDPINSVDPTGTTPVAIGADCSVPGKPPAIGYNPMEPQIHEMMGMSNGSISVFDAIAESTLGQRAYLANLAASTTSILDGGTKSKFGPKGPLCVVNCGTGPDVPLDEDGLPAFDKKKFEEIVVHGKRLPRDQRSGGKHGGGGDGCTSDCVDAELPDFSGRGHAKRTMSDVLADAYESFQQKKTVREKVEARIGDAFARMHEISRHILGDDNRMFSTRSDLHALIDLPHVLRGEPLDSAIPRSTEERLHMSQHRQLEFMLDYASPYAHTMLGLAGLAFPPADAADACLYLIEGDCVNAGIAAISIVGGDVLKWRHAAVATEMGVRLMTPTDAYGMSPGSLLRARIAQSSLPPRNFGPKDRSSQPLADLKRQTIDDPKTPGVIRYHLQEQRKLHGNSPYDWSNPPGYWGGHSDHAPFRTHGNAMPLHWELIRDGQLNRALMMKQQPRQKLDLP